jgi:hypothetical protein
MATGPRQTEIDSADDLFLGGEEELEENLSGAESSATEQDDASFDDEPPAAAIEESEPVGEFEDASFDDEPPAAAIEESEPVGEFEDEEGEKAPREKKKGVPVLQYYVIPVVGVVLIMSLGWTFALIARRGLVRPPVEVAKVKKVEEPGKIIEPKQEELMKPKRNLRTVRVPIQTEKEAEVKGQEATFKANIGMSEPEKKITLPKMPSVREGVVEKDTLPPLPGAPASKALPPEIDTGESLSVPVNHPFFILLRGEKGKKAAITFLNFSLNLLVSSKAAASEFNSKRALIREVIYLHYSRLSLGNLSTTAGRERIRRQLVAKLDKQIIQGKVRGVLFQEFYTR